MGNIKKNFIYNIIYQILALMIPLITIPYVSRTLGANGLGVYSYTYSIVYYFMIFAMLGLNNYGNRTIAKVRDDKKKLSIAFKGIYSMQLLTSLIMIFLYLGYITIFNVQYKSIAIIQSLYIISCAFDINWFFFGIENFKVTITRNIIIKVLSLICIFVCVKDTNDIWIYTLILSGGTLISQLLVWPFLRKYITNEKVYMSDIFSHMLPCVKLFLPVIAITIYKVMDKTMIGIFSNVLEVGYYEAAEKIVNVPNAVIAALGTVMLPRMSNLYAKGDEKKCKEIIEKSIKLMMFLSFSMAFGICIISQDFAVLFLGKEFSKAGTLIILLSITIIFLSWGNVIRTQYLIPKERDKEYIQSAFLGAIVNFIMNLLFIPKHNSLGACYGTIIAEFVVVLYQTYTIRKELPICKYLKSISSFFCSSIGMAILVSLINLLSISGWYKIILQVLCGIILYFLFNIKYIQVILHTNKKRAK